MSLYDFRAELLEMLLSPKQQILHTPPQKTLHKLLKNENHDNKGGRK